MKKEYNYLCLSFQVTVEVLLKQCKEKKTQKGKHVFFHAN